MKEKKHSEEEVSRKIFSNLFNIADPGQANILLEQYKLFIDHTHKLTERLESSNNLFITSNSLIFSMIAFIAKELPLQKDAPSLFIIFLLLLGFALTFSWLCVLNIYKKESAINYLVIQAIEKKFTTLIFSFKFSILSEEEKKRRSNVIVYIEALIPKLFITAYTLGSFIIVGPFLRNL